MGRCALCGHLLNRHWIVGLIGRGILRGRVLLRLPPGPPFFARFFSGGRPAFLSASLVYRSFLHLVAPVLPLIVSRLQHLDGDDAGRVHEHCAHPPLLTTFRELYRVELVTFGRDCCASDGDCVTTLQDLELLRIE